MTDTDDNWYQLKAENKIDSPALLIYTDRVIDNISLIKKMLSGPEKLRPHVKTCKAKEPVALMMEAGIRKFKCATISEAEMLATCAVPDVLLAYQLSEAKLKRFVQLIKAYPGTAFSCIVDNEHSAVLVSSIAAKFHLCITVWIDFNVGMDRTGIKPDSEAIALYKYVYSLTGIRVAGFHAYDGHIHEIDPTKRTEIINKAFLNLEDTRLKIAALGYPFPLLVAGGTPGFTTHALRDHTEVSPGTFIFWDKGYRDSLPEQKFLFAGLVLTRVISLPADDTLCIDLGHKSIASENEINNRVYFLNAPELRPLSHSEEHMVVYAGKGHGYRVGDILYALPFHICPTVALYERAICIKAGNPAGTWKIIARDRAITI